MEYVELRSELVRRRLLLWGSPQYSEARLSTLGLASGPLGHRTDLAVCGKKYYMEYFFLLAAQVLGRPQQP